MYFIALLCIGGDRTLYLKFTTTRKMLLDIIYRIGFGFVSLFTSDVLHEVVHQHSRGTTFIANGECLEENGALVNEHITTTQAEKSAIDHDDDYQSLEENELSTIDADHITESPILGPIGQATDYGTIIRQTYMSNLYQSLTKSVGTCLTITVAVIPVSLIMILLLYIDMNTANLCFEQMRRNKTLPRPIMKWLIIGDDVEAITLNFWFQSMLILLFGWQKFKAVFCNTLLLGFLLGWAVAVYKTILFIENINFTKQNYRYPGNFLFLVGVIYSSYLVAKKICESRRTRERESRRTRELKKVQIFFIISTQFFLGFCIAMIYRYAIVPWFNKAENPIHKMIYAMITPVLILIPMIICEHLALKSLRFADPGRTFVLVYFVNGVSLMLYCIMQAGVKSTWMYIALSLFRGFLQVFQTATVKLRNKMFIRFWEYLENTCHCIRLGQLPQDTDHHRRLRIDKEIQAMLYQNTALVLSQAYLALYLITNFHKQLWAILKEPVKRIFIAWIRN